jgi:hypothetical protein
MTQSEVVDARAKNTARKKLSRSRMSVSAANNERDKNAARNLLSRSLLSDADADKYRESNRQCVKRKRDESRLQAGPEASGYRHLSYTPAEAAYQRQNKRDRKAGGCGLQAGFCTAGACTLTHTTGCEAAHF